MLSRSSEVRGTDSSSSASGGKSSCWCLHVEGFPGFSFALDVMPSAMLQQHACYYVVLAAVSVLFHANELCHVDEILDPGLLGRIGGVRTFRRVHFSSQIPYQISSESTQHVQSEAKDMEADFS